MCACASSMRTRTNWPVLGGIAPVDPSDQILGPPVDSGASEDECFGDEFLDDVDLEL